MHMSNNGHMLALPRPETVAMTKVREVVLPAVVKLREQIALHKDIPAAREVCRGLEAYRKYVQDRDTRDQLAAECRRTEVLIGKLLGPGEPGRPEKTSPVGEVISEVPHNDRHKFRILAANEELVEELLSQGKVSRNTILKKIK